MLGEKNLDKVLSNYSTGTPIRLITVLKMHGCGLVLTFLRSGVVEVGQFPQADMNNLSVAERRG